MLLQYDSLPESVHNQIYDESHYDHYGKMGIAYEHSTIDKPTGQAE